MKSKIVGYRTSLWYRANRKWEWSCPVWFSEGMFAHATINSPRQFDNEDEAMANMLETMELFGVTKETPKVKL